ncbi:MAG: hypothetical protein KIT72_08945 [Polyangiaceae bacterium]|nr:hypothetical protein [Polyangiaceae bacterium]MCW5790536.1 hypothetical protein [Polyangiaceae bacterium]
MLTRLRSFIHALYEDAVDYAEEGRSPWARGALALYLAYAGVRHLADPLYRSWFAGLTLGLHELGHIVFAPFGRTWMLLGGSLMQLIVPAVVAVYLLVRQRDWFGIWVGQAWLAFSAWEVATYVEDANKERLPLVSFSGRYEHDWSMLLTDWRLLNSCDTIATVIRVGAFLTWATAMVAAWLLLYRMAQR